MIKNLYNIFVKYKIWFVTLIILNSMYGVFLWLINKEGALQILPSILLGSVILYSLICFAIYKSDKRKMQSVAEFIDNPSDYNKESCLRLLSGNEQDILNLIEENLHVRDEKLKNQKLDLKEYEEYIETWAHEIKTPLSLMTFVLDNRKDEIPFPIYQRLEYSRTKIQEDVERMLYYARVESNNLDYIFTPLNLKEICDDVIDEYRALISEQNITINKDIENIEVLSDKKSLLFILRQIFSNSIKYMDKEKETKSISIYSKMDKDNNNIILKITDNGIGVKSYDLPFIFDKGFTGDAGILKKQSTGIGLYLANKVAKSVKIKLEVSEAYKDGFEISLLFPIIE